jgi:hypothetical protein
MEDPAGFFRQRAGASFHRRRKYPVLSGNWLHEVNSARRFIAAIAPSWPVNQLPLFVELLSPAGNPAT